MSAQLQFISFPISYIWLALRSGTCLFSLNELHNFFSEMTFFWFSLGSSSFNTVFQVSSCPNSPWRRGLIFSKRKYCFFLLLIWNGGLLCRLRGVAYRFCTMFRPLHGRTSFCLFNDFIGSSIKGYMISAVVIIINFGRIQASKMLVLKVGLQLDLEIFMML